MSEAREALQRLVRGNQRFATGEARGPKLDTREDLVAEQHPFAIILGCSDSRVPAEIVFDQGLGDLFVIRVAGNIVAPSQIGSVEFAAEQFGTRLVVVLGHSHCGAVTATLQQMERSEELRSPNLRAIVDWIRPSVEGVVGGAPLDREAAIAAAVRANVLASVKRLRTGSEVLRKLIEDNGLAVVAAEYSLETGEVEFFAGIPPES